MSYLTPVLETQILSEGKYTHIVGVDEVGRGSLAGPVMVGGYIFDMNSQIIQGVNDSKKIPFKMRDQIFSQVDQQDYLLVFRSAKDIDKHGIVTCIQNCIIDLAEQIQEKFSASNILFLIDGIFKEKFKFNFENIVHGDAKVYSIALASIVAKVTRDNFMNELSKSFPMYGWELNKGYGTRLHVDSIEKNGLSRFHRASFCKKFVLN